MRIGINASFARKENTGIGQVTLNFLKELAKQETEHEYFVYLEEDLDLELPVNFQKRTFLPLLWRRDDLIRKFWWECWSLPGKLQVDKCDALISLYQSPTIIPAGKPHVMLVHDIIPELFPEYLNNFRKRWYYRAVKRGIAHADKIMANSHCTEKDLVKHFGIDASDVSVGYLDVDGIYKKPVSQKKGREVMHKYNLNSGYIYCGGGLEVRKNIERVILAYQQLLEWQKKEYFVATIPKLIISGKLMPELAPLVTDAESLVKNLNLTGHISLLNYVPQEDLPAIYANAKMFIYPSLYEGFGLPVLEAMNMGTPVITSKISSLPEVGGDSVLYCDPKNVEDIALVMKNMLLNRNIREELVRRGKERAQHFSMDGFVMKFLRLITQLQHK